MLLTTIYISHRSDVKTFLIIDFKAIVNSLAKKNNC